MCSQLFQNLIDKSYLNRVKIDITNTHINGRSLSWLGTDTSLNCGGVKQALWAQILPLNETMWSGVFSTYGYNHWGKADDRTCKLRSSQIR